LLPNTPFRLDRGADGWRHKIGNKTVSRGSLIMVCIDGEWIGGRYESDDLSSEAPRPRALLHTARQTEPLVIEEGCEAYLVR
jgi:hypothetical protein